MTRTPFLLARLHHHRLHSGGGLPHLLAACPTCQLAYFADPRSAAAELRIQAIGRRAEERLAEECPDHAHHFQIDDDVRD